MEQAAVVCYWFAMTLYLMATVLHAYDFVLKRALFAGYATAATGAGFLVHGASIALHWVATGEAPIIGRFNSLSLAAWALILIYFGFIYVVKVRLYGVALLPIAFAAMAAGLIVADADTFQLSAAAIDQLDSWRVAMHVALIMVANAGFAASAVASTVYLIQGTQLKRHKTSALMRRLPSLGQTQMIARRAIMLAYPVYTAGILLGIVRAIEFELNWWFDPRVMMSGVVWTIFGAYLLLYYRRNASGSLLARLAIVGLVAVIILAVFARTLPTGFHIFGL